MLTYPDINPVAIALGPLKIRWYGITYLVGFVVAWLLLRRRARQGQTGFTLSHVEDIIFYGVLGVILGGRLGSMFFYNFDSMLADPLSILRIWEGGMSFHGGLLGVLVAMLLFARKHDFGFWQVVDFIAPVVPVGLGAGRIGNFINGELWGKVTDVPWAFVVNGTPRHPSQLYEAFLEGLVMFVLLWTFSAKPRPVMAVSGLFALLYGIFRIAVEFVRLPDQDIGYLAFGWLTMGQVLSAPLVIVGILLLYFAYSRKETNEAVS